MSTSHTLEKVQKDSNKVLSPWVIEKFNTDLSRESDESQQFEIYILTFL